MKTVLLWLFCTVYTLWQYITINLATCDCLEWVNTIVQRTANAPFVYRIFAPLALDAMGNTPLAWIAWQAIWIGFFFALLWRWAQYWRVNPMLILPLFALIISVMLPTFYFSAYTLMEWDFWLWTWLFLLRFLSRQPLPVKSQD